MGRRSINTTKSGKYMNPTDQARKEARKKELKKNKRQRQMVRTAVLKMKDPVQILEELRKIDEMEFNVLQPSPLNEKVLKEKRKKLKETFDRVLKMYDKDEPEKWVELKQQEMEYEKDRAHIISYYESVKHAQSVQLHEIPLPTQVPEDLIYSKLPTQIPLPMDFAQAQMPKPILKKDSNYKERPLGVSPPGVPPGPHPLLQEVLREAPQPPAAPPLAPPVALREKKNIRFAAVPEDDGPPGETPVSLLNLDGEPMDTDPPAAPRAPPGAPGLAPPGPPGLAPPGPPAPKPTSLQQRMLQLSGQNIDEFMKEMEEVHKKRERDRAADLTARLSAIKHKEPPAPGASDSDSGDELPPAPPAPPGPPPGPPLRMPPGPPGPPPMFGMEPPGPGMIPPPMHPPGPPPGVRPPAPPLRPPPPGPPRRPPLRPPHTVLTAPPLLNPTQQQGATISAKPQIRNLSADVTRFVPSALRVKREDKKTKTNVKLAPKQPEIPKQAPSKDDAYMQFMREMEGLL